MPIRVAAIGMIHWHSLYDAAYLHHLAAMDDVEIVGIQDSNPDIALQRAVQIGGGIPTFVDYRQMISEVKPDFVLALGRHDTMAETAHFLLDNHIPFIIEKPMSYNARQLKKVLEKVKATKGFLAVPLIMRDHPFVQTAKKMVEESNYGPMTHFYARINRPSSARYPAWGSNWMLDPKVASGGCLRNLGVHGLDAFVHLTGEGEEIEVTGAQLSWACHNQEVEDYASVLVKSRNGVLGTIEVGNCFPRDGTDGVWKASFKDTLLTFQDSTMKLNTAEGETILPFKPQGDPSATALKNAINAAIRGENPTFGALDCYQAVRLIDLAYLASGNPYGTAEV